MRVLGGILLCIGTSIGGAILGLPIATAHGGFIASSFYIISCWAIMTWGAYLILRINLTMPAGSNLISMAKKTLGVPGALVTWIVYLVLLYTLVCAYLSGGADVTANLLKFINIELPHWQDLGLFFVIVGSVVALGIKSVDLVNRFIMLLKMGALIFLIFFSMFFINTKNLVSHNDFWALTKTFTVIITSFGYAIIIPSLRVYLNSDEKKLKLVVFFGSFIPLIIYLLWEAIIFGLVPPDKLLTMASHDAMPSELLAVISSSVNSEIIITAANIFMAVTVFTSFFGVSVSLLDFLRDGLQSKVKKDKLKSTSFIIGFLPPILIALYFPRLFQVGLSFAGIAVIILLIILPVMMYCKSDK